MLAIWSLVSLPFLKPAQTSGSSQFTLLKPVLENFEHDFASMWDECNCVVVWVFFGIAFLRDWNENWHTRVLWPLLSFPNWQFVNELNEGQLHLQAGTNGWQSGLEMNYYQADPGPLPPNSERHRASGGTLGTKADFFSFFNYYIFPLHWQAKSLPVVPPRKPLISFSSKENSSVFSHKQELGKHSFHVSLLEKHLKKQNKWWDSPGGPVV